MAEIESFCLPGANFPNHDAERIRSLKDSQNTTAALLVANNNTRICNQGASKHLLNCFSDLHLYTVVLKTVFTMRCIGIIDGYVFACHSDQYLFHSG